LVVDCQQIVQSFVQELTKLWTLFNQKEERKKKIETKPDQSAWSRSPCASWTTEWRPVP